MKCEMKVSYKTYEEAQQAAERLKQQPIKKARRIHAYRCPDCATFHVGHK